MYHLHCICFPVSTHFALSLSLSLSPALHVFVSSSASPPPVKRPYTQCQHSLQSARLSCWLQPETLPNHVPDLHLQLHTGVHAWKSERRRAHLTVSFVPCVLTSSSTHCSCLFVLPLPLSPPCLLSFFLLRQADSCSMRCADAACDC